MNFFHFNRGRHTVVGEVRTPVPKCFSGPRLMVNQREEGEPGSTHALYRGKLPKACYENLLELSRKLSKVYIYSVYKPFCQVENSSDHQIYLAFHHSRTILHRSLWEI